MKNITYNGDDIYRHIEDGDVIEWVTDQGAIKKGFKIGVDGYSTRPGAGKIEVSNPHFPCVEVEVDKVILHHITH